jgi:hypothetical protein
VGTKIPFSYCESFDKDLIRPFSFVNWFG